MRLLAFFLLISSGTFCFSQSRVSGFVYSGKPNNRLPYVHVHNKNSGDITTTDAHGRFTISGNPDDSVSFSAIGYEKHALRLGDIPEKSGVGLPESAFTLDEITLVAKEEVDPGIQKLDKLNLKLMPVNNAQDLLRSVSGLFIAQHAGGGKAEQIFLRGFDNDHGTDFAAFIDDVPVNLSNHAHGQGYADMHFIIPELIQDGDYYKGPYELKNGNFAVSGAARYKTRNHLEQNELKVDIGQYGFQRGLLMLNLLPQNQLVGKNHQNAYMAVEGTLNKGFFDASQDFEKLNAFFKYNLSLSDHASLRLSASHFTSSWNASGQIPLRAVEKGIIDWFGAIDNSEGGNTARTDLSVDLYTSLGKGQHLRNFAYYTHNDYKLYSNFTFFLDDKKNGDMIVQQEDRKAFGYLAVYQREDNIGSTKANMELSAGFRSDDMTSGLDRAVKRKVLTTVNDNEVRETNYWAYIQERWAISDRVLLQAGSRWDGFDFHIGGEQPTATGNRVEHRFSPKVSLFYNPTQSMRLFAKTGIGFHSNYTHSAIADRSVHPLPKAKAADIGTELRFSDHLMASAALWVIESDAEYLFVADVGTFENNGASRRRGLDLAVKYQPHKNLWFDWSGNLSRGKLLGEPKGQNTIPAAPRLTSTGSLTYNSPMGLDFFLGYRWMDKRPLTEDESVFADAYFLLDGSAYYNHKKFRVGLSAQNLLNKKWMEAVFYDASQLLGELEPVEDFHFTPGTPFFLKGSLSYYF